jgi:hypothetical protein
MGKSGPLDKNMQVSGSHGNPGNFIESHLERVPFVPGTTEAAGAERRPKATRARGREFASHLGIWVVCRSSPIHLKGQ